MLEDARAREVLPAISKHTERLRELAHEYAAITMLARTDGQPASPLSDGKELANYMAPLHLQQTGWMEVRVLGKFNGAVVNFNAHVAGLPQLDWLKLSRSLVESLDLEWN